MSGYQLERTEPGFDEWVEYCFGRGMHHFWEDAGDPEALRFIDQINSRTLVSHLIRLFEDPPQRLFDLADQHIADGINFIFGCASEYFPMLDHHGCEAETERMARVYTALAEFYAGFLDSVCNDRGRGPNRPYGDLTVIDQAVLGMSDSGVWAFCLLVASGDTPAPKAPDSELVFVPEPADKRVIHAATDTMESVLRECRTWACTQSVLDVLERAEHPRMRAVYKRHHAGFFARVRGFVRMSWRGLMRRG